MKRIQPNPHAPAVNPSAKRRRCPACRTIQDAAAFEPLPPGTTLAEGLSRRRCPSCAYGGPTRTFVVVVSAPARE